MLLIELFGSYEKKFAKKHAPQSEEDPLAVRNKLNSKYNKLKKQWGKKGNADKSELVKKMMRNVPIKHNKLPLPENNDE